MINIRKTKYADTRTCSTIPTKEQLYRDSLTHIQDVSKLMRFLADKLYSAPHDHTKLENIDSFYSDFINTKKTGNSFIDGEWYQNHIHQERHHLESFVHEDVNLLDVLEYIVDNVCAGKARSGEVRGCQLDDEVLRKAFQNTIKLLDENTTIDNSQ